MKKLLAGALILLGSFGAPSGSRAVEAAPLKPFKVAGKTGFKDPAGKVVIPPKYDDVKGQWEGRYQKPGPKAPHSPFQALIEEHEFFPEGLCAVRMGPKWGFVDAAGKIQINPVYETVQPFHKGLAIVKMADRWALIDPKGNEVRDLTYSDISDEWVNGLTLVKSDSYYGFMDGDYKDLGIWEYTEVKQRLDDRTPVDTLTGGENSWGYIGWDGKFAIQPAFSTAFYFHDDLACVSVGMEDDKRWGYIDRSGKWVIKAQFTMAGNFSGGLAPAATDLVESTPWNYGFIGPDGKFVIEPKFAHAYPFSDDLAAVLVIPDKPTKKGNWGFIDRQGKLAIPPRFTYVSSFSQGLAAFAMTKDSLFGLMDKKGKVVVEPKFQDCFHLDFTDGKAMVKLKGKYVYINKKGVTLGPAE